MARNRSETDAASGITPDKTYDKFPNFSNEELATHFHHFKSYDLDDSGFITPQNLCDILAALDIDVDASAADAMIEEVAVLSGHDNDGKLSFRDYMHCIQYEKDASAHNANVDAQIELRMSTLELRDEEAAAVARASQAAVDEGRGADELAPLPEAAVEPEPVPEPIKPRMRHSSLSVMHQVAQSRIHTFEAAVDATQKAAKEAAPLSKFERQLRKFKRVEGSLAPPPSVNNENLASKSIKMKLAAFEQANKSDPVAFKQSWKHVREGAWRSKKEFALGVAPPKSLADLP